MICRGVAEGWQGCQGSVSAGPASLVACPVPGCFSQGPGSKGVTHICDGLGKVGLLPLKPRACSCPWQCRSPPPSPRHHCDPPASAEVSNPSNVLQGWHQPGRTGSTARQWLCPFAVMTHSNNNTFVPHPTLQSFWDGQIDVSS